MSSSFSSTVSPAGSSYIHARDAVSPEADRTLLGNLDRVRLGSIDLLETSLTFQEGRVEDPLNLARSVGYSTLVRSYPTKRKVVGTRCGFEPVK